MVKPQPSGSIDKVTVRRFTFLLLVLGVTYWFFSLIQPFLMAVFWAIVLAIVFAPLDRWLTSKLPNREALVASLSTIIIFISVVLPLVLISIAVAKQVTALVARFNSGELDPNILINWAELQVPQVQRLAEEYGINFDQVRENVNSGVATMGQRIINWSLRMGQNFLSIAVEFFLMIYFLWFFLKDGRFIVDKLIQAVPLGNSDERMLITRFATVSRATLKGTIIVAVIQGTLGGILFWAVGIDASIFWGVVMTLLSLLPVGGSALVWAPAAIIMAIQGDWGKALIIVAFGGLAIGLVDNLLRPLLVGRDTQMPDYLVLITTLGGIASFGLAGFVIGPVIAALFLSVWEMMQREYGTRADKLIPIDVMDDI